MPDGIRLAVGDDADGLLAIYAPIVRDTWISFETEPPTAEEMQQRIAKTLEYFPWLVFESEGQVAGYAYASRHRERPAYQWSVDVSVYVLPGVQRRGIGRALYEALLAVLRLQGFQNAFAGIALPNTASVSLHESVGFEPIGVYRNVGYKLGAWRDVGWWQCHLSEPAGNPVSPRRLTELLKTEGLKIP